MRTTRTLSLRKEALTELSTVELADVAGAQATVPCPYSALQCATKATLCYQISTALRDCPWL